MREDAVGAEPEIIQAEVVEITHGEPWEWQDVRPVRPRRRRWRLPLVLFAATCLSTLFVGGLAYAVPVMIILVCHEMGPFPASPPLRHPCQLPLLHPHAGLAVRHVRRGDCDGAARGRPSGAV